jgi:hypothetical protein
MRTRTRHVVSKSVPGHGNVTLHAITYPCTGSPAASTTASGVVPLIETAFIDERISDELGRGKSHICTHRRRTVQMNENSPPYTGAQTNAVFVYSDAAYGDGWGFYRQLYTAAQSWNISSNVALPVRWTTSGLPINESTLIEGCFEKARQLKADVLLNIVEANQLWPSVKSLASCLPTLAANWNRVRKVVKTASGSYLAWKFGVSPILSDVMAINRFLPKLGEAVRNHMEQKPQRFSSVGEFVALMDTTPSNVTSLGGYTVNEVVYQGRVLKRPAIRYVLVVRPNRSFESDFFRKLDFAMSRFATSPASLAWEKVPFSFVVDWFVDLRGLCRAADAMVGFNPFSIVSFTRSMSYDLASDVALIRRSPCNGGVIHNEKCGTVEFSHYERSLASVGATAPTWKPRFGKNQAGITAALIAQMLSKTPKR